LVAASPTHNYVVFLFCARTTGCKAVRILVYLYKMFSVTAILLYDQHILNPLIL